jgi:hypothetical protein
VEAFNAETEITHYPEMDKKREFHPLRKSFRNFLIPKKEIRIFGEHLFSFPKQEGKLKKKKV